MRPAGTANPANTSTRRSVRKSANISVDCFIQFFPLQVLHHSAVGLANRLARRQLIKRVPDTQDRRHIFLALTPKGEAILERLSAAHRDQLEHMRPQLRRLLARLSRCVKGEKV